MFKKDSNPFGRSSSAAGVPTSAAQVAVSSSASSTSPCAANNFTAQTSTASPSVDPPLVLQNRGSKRPFASEGDASALNLPPRKTIRTMYAGKQNTLGVPNSQDSSKSGGSEDSGRSSSVVGAEGRLTATKTLEMLRESRADKKLDKPEVSSTSSSVSSSSSSSSSTSASPSPCAVNPFPVQTSAASSSVSSAPILQSRESERPFESEGGIGEFKITSVEAKYRRRHYLAINCECSPSLVSHDKKRIKKEINEFKQWLGNVITTLFKRRDIGIMPVDEGVTVNLFCSRIRTILLKKKLTVSCFCERRLNAMSVDSLLCYHLRDYLNFWIKQTKSGPEASWPLELKNQQEEIIEKFKQELLKLRFMFPHVDEDESEAEDRESANESDSSGRANDSNSRESVYAHRASAPLSFSREGFDSSFFIDTTVIPISIQTSGVSTFIGGVVAPAPAPASVSSAPGVPVPTFLSPLAASSTFNSVFFRDSDSGGIAGAPNPTVTSRVPVSARGTRTPENTDLLPDDENISGQKFSENMGNK